MTHGIDIFVDIHGEAGALRAGLAVLGCERLGDVHRHPGGRRTLFLGDLIDRGRDSRGVIAIVRPMLAAGEALSILGNHELNAVHWGVPRPDAPGLTMRGGSVAHRRQHGAFLAEYDGAPDALATDRAWLAGLAPCLDLGGLRAVHACWDGAAADGLLAATTGGALTPAAWRDAGVPGTALRAAVDTAIKGAEITLPHGATFCDKDGNLRDAARLRWWEQAPRSWADAVIAPARGLRRDGCRAAAAAGRPLARRRAGGVRPLLAGAAGRAALADLAAGGMP
jgi:hypothetical protein